MAEALVLLENAEIAVSVADLMVEVTVPESSPVAVTVADIVVEVVTSGPPGPPGTGGAGTVAYRHVQASAATVWTISHTLPFWPSVVVVDSTGRQVIPGETRYMSASSVQLTFSAALGGEAYLT
jgi:hypothetical protein